MLLRMNSPTQRFVSLLLAVSTAVVLAMLTWLSVQPDHVPVVAHSEEPPVGKGEVLSTTIQNPEGMPVTKFFPVVMSNYPPPAPVFGVQMSRIRESGGLSKALEAQVHWVRFGAFSWDKIEPVRTNPPTYHWGVVDETGLVNAANHGLETIAIIIRAPLWAQKYPGIACGPIKQESLGAFAEFLQTLVARYSAAPYHVGYWELGNEPDVDRSLVSGSSVYGCWGEQNDEYYGGRYYAEMLKVAYPAIKVADPGAQVLIGGLLLHCDPRDPFACLGGAHGFTPLKFLEGILYNGGGPYFDIVSYHAYSDYAGSLGQMTNGSWPGSVTAVPAKTGWVREVLVQYGYGDKGLINTEAALLCHESTAECLETQTMYLPRAYAEALALGLKAQTYYQMINENWWHTGLLQPDLTPKPVYHAYVAAASFLASATYEEPATNYPPGIEGYIFSQRGDTGHVDVIWSADGSAQAVTLPSGASAYDRYGELIASSGAIQVDYAPVYVERP